MRTFLALALSSAIAFASAASPRDAELRSQLVGTWQGVEHRDGVQVSGVMQLRGDGTFTDRSTVQKKGEKPFVVVTQGSWSVSNGTMIQKVTKATHPELLPPGTKSADKVLSVSGARLELEAEGGRKLVRERK